MRAPPRTTRRLPSWFAGSRERDLPRAADHHRRARADPALRREPASAGRLLLRRQQAAGRRHGAARCRARSFPTTTSATPTRPTNAWPSSSEPAVVVIKHANPCGVAIGRGPVQRLSEGLCLRSGVDLRRHRRRQPHAGSQDGRRDLAKLFLEVVIAPDATPEALDILAQDEERTRAAGRHPARSAARRHDHASSVGRRLPAAEPRQRPSRARAT